MKVLDVYPPQTPGKRPICEGTLSAYVIESNERREQYHKKEPWYKQQRRVKNGLPHDQCDNLARYKIGKRWLCRKHAAYALLDSMAERQPPL